MKEAENLGREREFRTVRGYQLLNAENKTLTSSMEDYLEMIYRTCIKEGFARVNQLAKNLNVSPSSATKIVQKLKEHELIFYQKYGVIELTEEGREMGEFLLKRHEIIETFLKNIGANETRLKDTEMIEHDVSLHTLESIYTFNEFLLQNPDIKIKYELFKAKQRAY